MPASLAIYIYGSFQNFNFPGNRISRKKIENNKHFSVLYPKKGDRYLKKYHALFSLSIIDVRRKFKLKNRILEEKHSYVCVLCPKKYP